MTNQTHSWLEKTSRMLAKSEIFREARQLWEENKNHRQLNLSKKQKLMVGLYLILNDFFEGSFPPTFESQQKVYDNEIDYSLAWPGLSVEESFVVAQSKPFWFGKDGIHYLSDFIEVIRCLEKLNISPPMKLLEIGCGTGWLSEFLAVMGFGVTGTTLSPHDIAAAKRRVGGLKAKGINSRLNFYQVPMETVEEILSYEEIETFDCVFVYEALHHAYSWQKTIESCFKSLRPGGWFLICGEPNLIHTAVSYRVSLLTATHEIGFNRKELISYLKEVGFHNHRILKNRFDFGIKNIWLAAQKDN